MQHVKGGDDCRQKAGEARAIKGDGGGHGGGKLIAEKKEQANTEFPGEVGSRKKRNIHIPARHQ